MPGGPHPPQSVVDSWPPPNYLHPNKQGPGLKIMAIVGAAFIFVIVTGRVYSRIFITRAFGWDDALAITSMAFTVALSVLIIQAYDHIGLGRHIWDFPPQWAANSRLNLWISEWCYLLASSAIKISVLLFYKRLSAPYTRAFWYATWAGIWYNVGNVISFGLCLLLLCRPLSAYWNQFSVKWVLGRRKYYCADEGRSLPASAAISLIGDIYSTVLPLILVHGLQMKKRQKTALYCLFALGFLVVASGIVRFYYLNYTINGSYDILWYLYVMWIWTLIELYAAITAASAPALKPFVSRYFIDPIRSRYGSYGNSRLEDNPPSSSSGKKTNTSSLKFPKVKVLSSSDMTSRTDMDTRDSKQDYEMSPRNTIPEHGIATQTTFTVRSDSIPEQYLADGNPASAQHRYMYDKTRPANATPPIPAARFQSPYSTPALRIATRELEQREAEHRASVSNSAKENRKGSRGLSSHPTGKERSTSNASTTPFEPDYSDRESQYHRKVVNNLDLSPATSIDERDVPNMPEHEPRDFVFDLDKDETDNRPPHAI